ncbi:MAG: WD40 repeat domain-containing protein [Candidatus Omnitrophica bacterium]|nr:WD40 repeat domain-containing protein [Candidatus Omnitrophota bacterium]
MFRKLTSVFLILSFVLSCIAPRYSFSQNITAVGLMTEPGTMVSLTPAFTPAYLKGMVINPNDPFKFDFLVFRGDEALTDAQKQVEYPNLIKYFLAALAVPDTDQWVNLSPYEKDRIIPDNFGLTIMGRDLLAQDYLLKQISSSLTHPDTDLGKKFWDGIYAEAHEKFGTTDIPTDTFNKVWIVPDKAVVYEKGNTVYVLENHLKVMIDKDYLAMKENNADIAVTEENGVADISHKVMREVIIPAIEKEVNEGKNFAPLRQVYSGMLLATWYKRALKESILSRVYADQGKVKGIDQDPARNQEIYTQYVSAFKRGVFNMIKEDVDRFSQEVIPRKYFSGGTKGYDAAQIIKADEALGQKDFAQQKDRLDDVSAEMKNMTPEDVLALDEKGLTEYLQSLKRTDGTPLFTADQVAQVVKGRFSPVEKGGSQDAAMFNDFDRFRAYVKAVDTLKFSITPAGLDEILGRLGKLFSMRKTQFDQLVNAVRQGEGRVEVNKKRDGTFIIDFGLVHANGSIPSDISDVIATAINGARKAVRARPDAAMNVSGFSTFEFFKNAVQKSNVQNSDELTGMGVHEYRFERLMAHIQDLFKDKSAGINQLIEIISQNQFLDAETLQQDFGWKFEELFDAEDFLPGLVILKAAVKQGLLAQFGNTEDPVGRTLEPIYSEREVGIPKFVGSTGGMVFEDALGGLSTLSFNGFIRSVPVPTIVKKAFDDAGLDGEQVLVQLKNAGMIYYRNGDSTALIREARFKSNGWKEKGLPKALRADAEKIWGILGQHLSVDLVVGSSDGKKVLTTGNGWVQVVGLMQDNSNVSLLHDNVASMPVFGAFSLDGTKVLTVGGDNKTVTVYMEKDGVFNKTSEFSAKGIVYSAVVSNDGQRIFILGADGFSALKKEGSSYVTESNISVRDDFHSLAISPDNQRLTMWGGEYLAIWERNADGLLKEKPLADEKTMGLVKSAVFSPNGQHAFVLGERGWAQVMTATPERIIRQTVDNIGDGITSGVFSKDNELILAGEKGLKIFVAQEGIFSPIYEDISRGYRAVTISEDALVSIRQSKEAEGQWDLNVSAIKKVKRVLSDQSADNAMKGGIDLAASNLDMQIKRDGSGVPLPISQQNLDSIRIDGLVPVILDIKPAASIPLFSETAPSSQPAA